VTAPPADGDPRFADLLDELLEQLLNGGEPDLAEVRLRHGEIADRVDEAWSLACGVAGRRETTRPSLRGYHIVRELGRGGMGTVYLAKQESLDREVALKVLPHSFGLSAHSRRRFLEEARALARVQHEHIVGIHHIVDDGDLLAFEMEFIDGPSLQHVLDHLRKQRDEAHATPSLQHVADLLGLPVADLGAPNPMQFFVRVAIKIGRALGAVHAHGFVHRDVKPSNILLRRTGEPVLADFGLVRDSDPNRTLPTGFAGTPVYSSPEQLRGGAPIGPPTDVYALAVTLYECLTLAPPFAGRTTTDLLSRIESGRVPPLRAKAPQAPRDLETITSHAMELEPARRYADGTALADDLQRLLDLQPIQARPIGVLRRVGKFLRRNRLPLLAGCAGALLVATAMLPVLDSVQAAGRARELAQVHVRQARHGLIAIDYRRITWQQALWGDTAHPRTARAADVLGPLQTSLDEYDRALALDPDDEAARREGDVVRLSLWLRQLTVRQPDSLTSALASDEFRRITANVPPVTLRAAQALAAGEQVPLGLDDLPAATDADRLSLGLLAFLFGEFRLCEQAWSSLGGDGLDQPLLDAGLGLLFLADGMPDRAYVRLMQAQRHFPDSAALALELADAALALGDTDLARHWLQRSPADERVAPQRARIEIDLRAAGGELEAAAHDYEKLAALDPFDPTPRHRQAWLAMRAGRLDAAAAQLDGLVAEWPEVARFRLDRARVALQSRDLPAYARQVLAVLDQEHGRGRSRGTVADLLEILRIGGLAELHREGVAATGGASTGRAWAGGELPIRAFVPARLADGFEPLAREVGALQRHVDRLLGDHLLDGPAALLVMAPAALSRLPALATMFTVPERVGLEAAPWAVRYAYPFVQPLARLVHITVFGGEWHFVDLHPVEPPADLHEQAVFGSSLARGSDVDGDGVDDVLIACGSVSPLEAHGRIRLVSSRTTATLAEAVSESSSHMFGHALAKVGDLDGDGTSDWLVGAPSGVMTEHHGQVELRSGRDLGLLHLLTGDGPSFGVGVAGLGDCDGDGCPDFAVATPPIVRNSAAQGSVQVFSGRTRTVLHTLENDVAGVWFGAAIAAAGDADADGRPDLLVGGNFGEAPGLVQLYSGRTGAVLQTWTDSAPNSGFGSLVLGAGDVDRDGCADVLVAAMRRGDKGGVDQVFFFSGRNGTRLGTLSGTKPGAWFGAAVVPYRDPTADRMLFAIGAPLGGAGTTGAVELWLADGTKVSTLLGPRAHGRFGGSLTTCGDLDGDRRPELFVGETLDGHQGNVWRVDSRGIRFER